MKTFLLLAISSLTTAAVDLPGLKLVWSEEFDKTGPPDPAKWSHETGFIRNNEKQFYTDNRSENARIESGHLIIEARKESWQGAQFTSASLTSKGHESWTYGRIEVKAKLPKARGTWPAIWMLANDKGKVPWPLCGEIDIMEHVGHDPGRVHQSLHTGTFNHIKKTQLTQVTALSTPASEFHLYVMDWTPDRIVFQIDGKSTATFDRKPDYKYSEWPFDKPFYLILNLAIGGSWGGQKGIEEVAFPQRMEVDYVRVYQKM